MVVVLLAGSAFLALAETGLVRTSRAQGQRLADEGRRGAKVLVRLTEDPEGFLNPVLLLVLFCQLVAATLVGHRWPSDCSAPSGVAAATVFEVVVIFVFAEAVPKHWAVRHPDRAALFSAPLVSAVVSFPPVRVHLGCPDRSGQPAHRRAAGATSGPTSPSPSCWPWPMSPSRMT